MDRYKDDGIPFAINSPFCCTNSTITVRQSRSIEDREIGKQFALLWKVLADQLKLLFLDGDDEGAFIVPALDARSQILSIKDRSNGVGKPVLKLAPFGNGRLFAFVTPDLRVPGVSSEVLQRVISQASSVMAGHLLHRFFAAWRVEAPLSAVSRFDGSYTLCSI